MDYEKEYKSIVAKIKIAYTYALTDSTKNVLETIFPDLAESEDERIRKEILHYILYNAGATEDQEHRWVSWLEKQKEQEPEHFELKAGKWYICHHAFCCRADHLTVKEGERFMCEKDGVVKGFVIKEPEKYFIECSAPAPIENELEEQKPAEWSEEDKQKLNRIYEILGYAADDKGFLTSKRIIGDKEAIELQDFLRTLRPSCKPSGKQEEPEYYQHFDPDC